MTPIVPFLTFSINKFDTCRRFLQRLPDMEQRVWRFAIQLQELIRLKGGHCDLLKELNSDENVTVDTGGDSVMHVNEKQIKDIKSCLKAAEMVEKEQNTDEMLTNNKNNRELGMTMDARTDFIDESRAVTVSGKDTNIPCRRTDMRLTANGSPAQNISALKPKSDFAALRDTISDNIEVPVGLVTLSGNAEVLNKHLSKESPQQDLADVMSKMDLGQDTEAKSLQGHEDLQEKIMKNSTDVSQCFRPNR